jgi:hypothetical protein
MLTSGHSALLPSLIAEKEKDLEAYGDAFVLNYRNAEILIKNTLPGIDNAVGEIDRDLRF